MALRDVLYGNTTEGIPDSFSESETQKQNIVGQGFTPGTLSLGAAVYIDAAGTIQKALATSLATSTVAGFVIDVATGTVQSERGQIVPHFLVEEGGALQPGKTYYLSNTLGKEGFITATAPSGAGTIVAAVGVARDTDKLFLDPQTPYRN